MLRLEHPTLRTQSIGASCGGSVGSAACVLGAALEEGAGEFGERLWLLIESGLLAVVEMSDGARRAGGGKKQRAMRVNMVRRAVDRRIGLFLAGRYRAAWEEVAPVVRVGVVGGVKGKAGEKKKKARVVRGEDEGAAQRRKAAAAARDGDMRKAAQHLVTLWVLTHNDEAY